MDPYLILGIPPDASDEAIRTAYLAAIRVHTPDHSPERFAQISKAYEAIKSDEQRLERLLGQPEPIEGTPGQLLLHLAQLSGSQPRSAEKLTNLLRTLA